MNDTTKGYGAKRGYRQLESALDYESRPYYSGLLGAIRKYREQAIVSQMLNFTDGVGVLLDCPCGNGRWFELLSNRFRTIIGLDVSWNMTKVASIRANIVELAGKDAYVLLGEAERLPLASESVDYVYSFALMKHLPNPVKSEVLLEFARVCRRGVICSFALFTLPAYIRWRIRNEPESCALWQNKLSDIADDIGLTLEKASHVMGVLGLEAVVYFAKK